MSGKNRIQFLREHLRRAVISFLGLVITILVRGYHSCRRTPEAIYFYYDQSIHQIHHTLYIAIELSNIQKRYPVFLLCLSQEAAKIIEQELSSIPNRVHLVKVWHPGYASPQLNINWSIFWARLRIARPKAMVVADYYDNVLRQLGVKTFWVYVPHGLINRQFASDPHVRDYDLVFLPGERDRAEFDRRLGELRNVEVIGYTKFDYFQHHDRPSFSRGTGQKPVVLYNPHFEESLSSFFNAGAEFLQALSAGGKVEVLFMPHPDLSRRYPRLLEPLRGLAGVQMVERPAVNLEWLARADVYVTDVSSTAFEWLYFDKPMVFLDTVGIEQKEKQPLPSWQAGPVAKSVPQALEMIALALADPLGYQAQRRQLREATFAHSGERVAPFAAVRILARCEGKV